MEFLQLKYFVTAARFEHITRAAESLNIAQPALSQSIRRLEGELGVTLFTREGRQVRLSEKGRQLLELAAPILVQLEHLETEMRGCQKQTGTIQVCLLDGAYVFSKIFSLFRTRYRDADFNIALEPKEQTLLDESLIIDSAPSGSLPIEALYLFDEELMLAVSADSHFAARDHISLSELRDMDFVANKHDRLIRQTEIYCKRAGFTPRINYRVSTNGALRLLVEMNSAVSLWPKSIISEIETPKIVFRHLQRPVCLRNFYILPPKSRPMNETELLFCSFSETLDLESDLA